MRVHPPLLGTPWSLVVRVLVMSGTILPLPSRPCVLLSSRPLSSKPRVLSPGPHVCPLASALHRALWRGRSPQRPLALCSPSYVPASSPYASHFAFTGARACSLGRRLLLLARGSSGPLYCSLVSLLPLPPGLPHCPIFVRAPPVYHCVSISHTLSVSRPSLGAPSTHLRPCPFLLRFSSALVVSRITLRSAPSPSPDRIAVRSLLVLRRRRCTSPGLLCLPSLRPPLLWAHLCAPCLPPLSPVRCLPALGSFAALPQFRLQPAFVLEFSSICDTAAGPSRAALRRRVRGGSLAQQPLCRSRVPLLSPVRLVPSLGLSRLFSLIPSPRLCSAQCSRYPSLRFPDLCSRPVLLLALRFVARFPSQPRRTWLASCSTAPAPLHPSLSYPSCPPPPSATLLLHPPDSST